MRRAERDLQLLLRRDPAKPAQTASEFGKILLAGTLSYLLALVIMANTEARKHIPWWLYVIGSVLLVIGAWLLAYGAKKTLN